MQWPWVLAPGLSIGAILTDNLTFGDATTYEWELNAAGTSDTVLVGGTLSFGATATLALIDFGGTPDPLTEYILFSYTGSDPTNPVWTIDNSSAPAWDISAASITVSSADNRVVLTGLATATGLPGDYNGDEVVSALDYTAWRNVLGQTGPGLAADGDGSGTIDQGDYDVWKMNFGNVASSSLPTSAGVLEPSSAAILLATGAASAVARRRAVRCTPS